MSITKEQQNIGSLYQRENSSWKLIQDGYIQRPPRKGESLVVAETKRKFNYTGAITKLISISESPPNLIEIVFQDRTSLWKLNVPTSHNNIDKLKKELT